jgi:hypothetical protein
VKHVIKKRNRALAIKILEGAKERLMEHGVGSWAVCPAISYASWNMGLDGTVRHRDRLSDIAWKMRYEIAARLGGNLYVTDWLEDQGVKYHQLLNKKKVQKYRLRWIDSMIQELQD